MILLLYTRTGEILFHTGQYRFPSFSYTICSDWRCCMLGSGRLLVVFCLFVSVCVQHKCTFQFGVVSPSLRHSCAFFLSSSFFLLSFVLSSSSCFSFIFSPFRLSTVCTQNASSGFLKLRVRLFYKVLKCSSFPVPLDPNHMTHPYNQKCIGKRLCVDMLLRIWCPSLRVIALAKKRISRFMVHPSLRIILVRLLRLQVKPNKKYCMPNLN